MINSPLRYPGGKAKMFGFFQKLLLDCELIGKTYCEPYAGGAGLALQLLSTGLVGKIRINDIDPGVYAFWKAVKFENEQFCKLVQSASLSIDEWRRQKTKLSAPSTSELDRGFAFFYLNRTNRSGIIEGAGPIGGYSQSGKWLIDARFNKEALISSIRTISRFSAQIDISNMDAVEFCNANMNRDSIFYLDPPYYVKGSKLYRNHYKPEDHAEIRDLLKSKNEELWILTYDNNECIRDLYSNFDPVEYELIYSAGKNGLGKEVMFLSNRVSELVGKHPSVWLSGSQRWGVQRAAF
jgi:DNA adenine methylase